VIGISALQAFFAGLGLVVAGVPGASLITSAVPYSRNHSDRPIDRSDPTDHMELDYNGNNVGLAVHGLHDSGQYTG
jgi:hypothetical protein